MLFYSKVIVSTFPFRIWVKLIKSTNRNNEPIDSDVVKAIRSAIFRAGKLTFWKNVCLVNSLAARLMLERRGIGSVIYLGLKFENGKKMNAHAWLMVGDAYVTPRGDLSFKEIYKF